MLFSAMPQMGTKAPTVNATRPPLSITAAALVLLAGSLVTFLGSTWYLRKAYAGSMSQFLLYAHSFSIALLDLLAILLVVFGLLGIVTSIGLLYLQEPARKAAIFLSTAPISVVVFALFLLLTENSQHGAESMNAAFGFIVCGVVFVPLLPLSIWWLALFTRDKVRSQFR
jgi:heme/copper-type cytochrome/quinol oxidase subunit 4